MATYNHGVRVLENPTSITAPILGTAGLQVVIGTSPVNLAADPYNATNRPMLAYSFAEASAAVGYNDDFKNYNLCESIDASFRVLNVAPIVLINVLDPKVHRKKNPDATLEVEDFVVVLKQQGVLLDTVKVTKSIGNALAGLVGDGKRDKEFSPENIPPFVEGTDYTLAFDDDGNVIVTVIPGSAAAEEKYLRIESTSIDPSAVTYEDIIGGYNVSTGEEKGLEVIRQVFPLLQLTPGLLVSPGWSSQPNVGAAIAAKCTGINGVFSCEAVVDLSTEEGTGARKYTDVMQAKQKAGFVSPRLSVEWPCVKIGEKIYHASAIKAALTAYTDASNDDVPSLSPSNKLVSITGLCLADGTEVIIDEQQANLVNSYGVCTFNNFSGWTTWGNNTAIYPSSTDPKDRWFCCRRFFSWWENTFILTYHQRVDNPNDPRQVEAIVDSENIRGNSYTAQGKCAGAYIEYRSEDNPITDVLNGKMQFYHHLAPFTPAEDILDVFEFDPDLLEAAFTGGE